MSAAFKFLRSMNRPKKQVIFDGFTPEEMTPR